MRRLRYVLARSVPDRPPPPQMGFPEVRRVPTVTSQLVAKKGQQRLSPLNDNTTYMVRLAARNQYGWTPPADAYFIISGGQLTVTQGQYLPMEGQGTLGSLDHYSITLDHSMSV